MEANRLLPAEQRGCIKGTYGCKEHLLLNKLVIEHARKNSRNLAMAWIDYSKAFDTVPHSWIERAMNTRPRQVRPAINDLPAAQGAVGRLPNVSSEHRCCPFRARKTFGVGRLAKTYNVEERERGREWTHKENVYSD